MSLSEQNLATILFLFTGTEGTAAGGLLQKNGLEKY